MSDPTQAPTPVTLTQADWEAAISSLLGEIDSRFQALRRELADALEHDLEALALIDARNRARDLAEAIDLLGRIADPKGFEAAEADGDHETAKKF